jgi:hypothetical protein
MEQVLRVIAEYQWWLYAFFGLIVLFYLRRAIVARRESVRSIFKLEQEQARERYIRSVLLAGVVILLVGGLFGLMNYYLPSLAQPPAPTATATTGPLAAPTLTATPAPATITPTITPTLVRPTRPVMPTDTPEAAGTEVPQVQAPICPNPNVRITSPGMNQIVQGNVAVRGTAMHEAFDYYKIEVGPGANPRDNEWAVVGQLHDQPVADGVLATFNSGAYPTGTYTLRLVVVDQTGNFPEPCRVTVTVQR